MRVASRLEFPWLEELNNMSCCIGLVASDSIWRHTGGHRWSGRGVSTRIATGMCTQVQQRKWFQGQISKNMKGVTKFRLRLFTNTRKHRNLRVFRRSQNPTFQKIKKRVTKFRGRALLEDARAHSAASLENHIRVMKP